MAVKTLKVRTLDPGSGDTVKVMTVEEAVELAWGPELVTVFPNGEVVRSYEELRATLEVYKDQEEVELMRFPPLAGG